MLDFKTLTLADIPVLRSFFAAQCDRICDYSVVSLFMWREFFKTEYAIYNNTLIIKVQNIDEKRAFTFPMGNDVSGALEAIRRFCGDEEIRFCAVPESKLDVIKDTFGIVCADYSRDWVDYLYNAQDHVNMSGKRFHKIKNRINRFEKLYPDWKFEKITPDNLSAARIFFEGYSRHTEKNSDTFHEEERKVFEVFDHYEEYGVFGALMRIEDKVIGMAMGEIVGDTLFVHIEKADVNYDGVYQVIVREFARMFVGENVKYINREEDCGDEGLRKSKLSYRPVELLKKYNVVVRHEA